MSTDAIPVTWEDIQEARRKIQPYSKVTPVLQSKTLNSLFGLGKEILLKCENFNTVGAFKIRGASNAILKLVEQHEGDNIKVVTHSSGNHAQAVAAAAQLISRERNLDIRAHIIMPNNAPVVKKNAVRDTYGAEVYECEPTQQARETLCGQVQRDTDAHFIHPYNDWDVITGQATSMAEFYEQLNKDVDAIVCCVGGGGFLSGTSISAHFLDRKIRVFGAEPEEANDAYRSLKSGERQKSHEKGQPNTCCDGLLTILGDYTFTVIKEHVEDIFTVTEEQIVRAMKFVWERMKIVIEPSSATVVAVVMFNERFRETVLADDSIKRIGLMISGGNVELGPKVVSLFQKYT